MTCKNRDMTYNVFGGTLNLAQSIHTGFSFVLKLMTLNGVMAIMLRYFTELGSFGASYVTMIAVRPILLQQKCSPKNLILTMYDLW